MKKNAGKDSLFSAVLFSLFLLLVPASPAHSWELYVSSPWLSTIARFIGGVNVSVKAVQEWNEEGIPIRKIRSRNIPANSRIVALDAFEATSLGLDEKRFTGLFMLYGTVPFDRTRADYHFSDPSVLPFIAQRVLTALSQFDPGNYSYYQRRLSEFQTRLDSTVLVGRQLLKDYPVFDLSGGFSSMLSAAGCTLLPGDEKVKTWSRGEDLQSLQAAVSDAVKRRIPVIVDPSTPKPVREALKGNKDVLFQGRPGQEQDLLLFSMTSFFFCGIASPHSGSTGRKEKRTPEKKKLSVFSLRSPCLFQGKKRAGGEKKRGAQKIKGEPFPRMIKKHPHDHRPRGHSQAEGNVEKAHDSSGTVCLPP